MTEFICEWCREPFEHENARGPKPKYCSDAHRQKAHRQRRKDDRRVGDRELTCEQGHHWVQTERPTSATKCPVPVRPDGHIATWGLRHDITNPFSNPDNKPCGADISTVTLDIFDYEEGRY